MRTAAAALLVMLLAPRGARADDWLASLPACGLADRASVPSFELLYPRPSLPAVVEAGDTLIARVRLPAPLTPPPGVQQPRALVGWRAELIGHAHALARGPSRASAQVQRQALEVVNVRPDAAQSLVYRASIPIPAWVAPGSYGFSLWAPGGSGSALSVLRVLEPGHAPRLGWLGGEVLPATMAVSALPVDVWARAPSTATGSPDAPVAGEPAAAPILDPVGLVAALRIGTGLWVLGSCDSPQLAYEDEVGGMLARERRSRAAPTPAPSLTRSQWQPFGSVPQAWPEPVTVRFEPGEDRLRVQVAASYPGPAELRLLLPPDGHRTEVSGTAVSFHPASAIETAGALPALVASLAVPSGGDVLLLRGGASPDALHARLEARPAVARSGEPVQLRMLGIEPATKVAWRLDHLSTAFGRGAIEHSFQPLGEHSVIGLAIAEDGTASRLSTRVQVVTAQASGCRCSLHALEPARPTRSASWPRAVPWLFALLLASRRCWRKRRLPDDNRNRLRSQLGCGQT